MRNSRVWRQAVLLVLGGWALGGCVRSMLATRLVKAPNAQSVPRIVSDPKAAAPFDKTYAEAWQVPVGPPAAVLSVAVIEPGDYQLKQHVDVKRNPDGSGTMNYQVDWKPRAADAPMIRPKGTVVLLHGIMVTKEYMIHWALHLAQDGYRTVLVDLRGHGRSTGKWITYGAVEARDLKQVLDDLERRGAVTGRVGVLGISYGAAVGLDWGARDPRVATIVALEPFSDPRQAIIEFSRGFYPGQTKGISDVQFASAESTAAHRAGFQWSDADVVQAVERLRGPVLFYHGGADQWISPTHSERLMAVAQAGSRRVVLPEDNHLTLAVRLDPIGAEVTAWFDAHLR